MQAIQHYGIIISWFQDKQLGVVRDKDDTTARLLLLAADLPAGYREPKVGDEITYIAGMDDQNRPCALSPAPVGMQAAEPFAESGATVNAASERCRTHQGFPLRLPPRGATQ